MSTKFTIVTEIFISRHPPDIMLEYVISGMVAVYQHWFNSGRREPIEKISETLSVLAFSSINGIMANG